MNFELVDNDEYLPKLRNYLNYYLRGRIEYQHLNPKNNQPTFTSIIHFHNLDTSNSIYFFKNEDFTYLGLGKEINNLVNINANTKFSANLKYNLKIKNSIYFAKDELGKIFLLMPINYELLSDKETCSLKYKNEIIVLNNEEYINFGELTRGIHILRNIRNFMENVQVDTDYTSFLKLLRVHILHKFSKDSQFCQMCDNIISKSYENNEIIHNLVGKNPKICADCYSKKLMDYYFSKTPDIFLNRYYLEMLAENSLDLKFYLDLFDKYGMFDKNGFLHKNSKQTSFVPPKYLLNSLFLENMQSYVDLINEKTMIYEGEKLSEFEKILLKNNLSYAEGFEIKNKLENYVLSGKIKLMKGKTPKNIDKKLEKLINGKTISKKKGWDVFEIIEILNRKTLNSKGELNENFIKHVTSYGLDKNVCWNIRNKLIKKINSQSFNKNNFQKKYDSICDEIIRKELDILFTKKKCYCVNNSVYLKTIINQKEMVSFIKNLNSIKNAFEINNFNLIKLHNNFFKIILEIKVTRTHILNDFLNKFGFNKKLLYLDNGEG